MIKKTVYFIVGFVIIAAGCSKADYTPYSYSNEQTIYSEADQTVFRELLLIIKPYVLVNGEKHYLVAESVSNVKININDQLWGAFPSMQVDTSLYESKIWGDYLVTSAEVKYPVIAPYQTSTDTLTTAGDYADLLNNYFTLEPGFYICEIESFDIWLPGGKSLTVKTTITEPIEVKENNRSTFVGEFEVLINE